MSADLLLKTSRPYLRKEFPENIAGFFSNKDKRVLKEKKYLLKRGRKRIRKTSKHFQRFFQHSIKKENISNQKVELRIPPKVQIIYPPEFIKTTLLRIPTYGPKSSDFLIKLKERKKLSFLYGKFSKKYYQKALTQVTQRRGSFAKNLLIPFERRLDIILYRIQFSKTIGLARHYIRHNLVSVNGLKVNLPTYQLKVGDIITIDQERKDYFAQQIFRNIKIYTGKRRSSILYPLKGATSEINKLFSVFLGGKKKKSDQATVSCKTFGDPSVSFFNKRLSFGFHKKNQLKKTKTKHSLNKILRINHHKSIPLHLKNNRSNSKHSLLTKTGKVRILLTSPICTNQKKVYELKNKPHRRNRRYSSQCKDSLLTNSIVNSVSLKNTIDFYSFLNRKIKGLRFKIKRSVNKKFKLLRKTTRMKRHIHKKSFFKKHRIRRIKSRRSFFRLQSSLRIKRIAFTKLIFHHLFANIKRVALRNKNDRLSNSKQQRFLKLILQRLLSRKYSYRAFLFALKSSPMKPINIEVSFKTLTAIVLFYPQKIAYPTWFDLNTLTHSFQKS